MSVMHPFTPISLIEKENAIRADLSVSSITFGRNSLPTSIIADGEELLAAPVRVVGTEDDEAIVWKTNDSFIYSRSEEEAIICGSMQSEMFIINTAITLGYDGCMAIDLKLMPRGKTVAEVFGMSSAKAYEYRLGSLIVEIPLKKSAKLYHVAPNCRMMGDDGELVPQSSTSASGNLPEGRRWLPHRPILWLGDENRGLCFFSQSYENWQPTEYAHSLEIVDEGDARILRVHLLDSHPKKWDPTKGGSPSYAYKPISFDLGLEPTPIKPFPKKPYLHNALHIDCFNKISGNYKEYLASDFGSESGHAENGYDRMKRLGVTTLILHEKWNKMQNFPYLSEPTANQLKTIIRECHTRGIKVIPYFGYELSSLSPLYTSRAKEALYVGESGDIAGGWWRVPPQRDYIVCYASSWQDTFVEGIKNLIEEYDFDGIYLDTTINARACTNELHGCGYIGDDGKRHGTYRLMEIRRLMKRLYEIVEPRGGIVNYHSFEFANITAMGFAHLGWNGESIQFKLLKEGASELPLDYFRAEYIGRNFGVPQELIAYENRPKWTFEQSCAFAIIHGILPRPNSILSPLDFISNVWRIFDGFPIEFSKWVPYWENDTLVTGDEKIMCSYYEHIGEYGDIERLIFVANTTAETKQLSMDTNGEFKFGTMTENGEMPPYSFGIFVQK